MKLKQYLLSKLAEECAEVARIALKTQQFGFYESMQGSDFTNAERIHQQLDNFTAIVELLNDAGLEYYLNHQDVETKKTEVAKYFDDWFDLGFDE